MPDSVDLSKASLAEQALDLKSIANMLSFCEDRHTQISTFALIRISAWITKGVQEAQANSGARDAFNPCYGSEPRILRQA